jgi:NAD(P)-dependent dehydrogenase (short-subunit alcohol dehydrogenase family)
LAFVRELARTTPSRFSTIFAISRSEKPSAALRKVIELAPGRIQYVRLDVTSDESISAAVTAVTSHLKHGQGLDVLINNAAILDSHITTKVFETPDLSAVLETKVTAVHNMSRAFLALLRQGKDKKIINIGSTLGSLSTAIGTYLEGVPTPAYNISKAGLNMLTLQWAKALKDEGFCVMVISPGNLKTELGGLGMPDRAEMDPSIGAKACLAIVEGSGTEDTGRFRNIYVEGSKKYDGKDIVW